MQQWRLLFPLLCDNASLETQKLEVVHNLIYGGAAVGSGITQST